MQDDQEKFKKRVREWLKNEVHKDREWLSRVCGVHKRTIDNWLSTQKTIPDRGKILIVSKMKQMNAILRRKKKEEEKEKKIVIEQPFVAQEVQHVLGLSLTSEQLLLFNKLATKRQQSILDWIMNTLLDKAEEENSGK